MHGAMRSLRRSLRGALLKLELTLSKTHLGLSVVASLLLAIATPACAQTFDFNVKRGQGHKGVNVTNV